MMTQSKANDRAVTLQEITADTVRAVIDLTVYETQAHFVASNAISLAQALFHPEAWYRAIYMNETPVGFVMLYDETLQPIPPSHPKITLWRLMVDANFQGQGIGKAALKLIIAHAQSKKVFSEITTSYVPGPGCPEAFYLKAGFHPTGETEEGEVILTCPIKSIANPNQSPDQ